MKNQIVAAVVVAAAMTGCQHQAGPGASGNPSTSSSSRPAAGNAQPARTLNQPGALAAGPAGVLFIADDTRNMIFARYPSGRILAVAGTGRRGFSGDGRHATAAQIADPGGMVYDRASGTLFFADTGNNRVRAISRSGVIRTVAGSGHAGWVVSGAQADTANLARPSAVTLSTDGRLYIACDLEVLRLGRDGRVTRIAGVRHEAGITGANGPALSASTDSANGLAFDAAGDLYLTGSATKGLLVVTPSGRMRVLCASCFYPRGNGGIVTAPDGSVVAMNTQRIYRYTSPTRRTMLINFEGHKPVDGVTAIAPTGLAVTPNGTIYIDTNKNGGFTSATTLIAINPRTTRPTVVWKQ